MSKVEVPLPKFKARRLSKKSDAVFVRMIAERAEKVLGKYTWDEHCACMEQVCNGGRLNRVFEELDVEYATRPVPDQPASYKNKINKASKKRKGGKTGARPSSLKEKRVVKKAKVSKAPEKKNSCVPQDQPSIDEYLLAKPLKPTTKRPFNDETGVKAAKVPKTVSGAPMYLASHFPVYNVDSDEDSSSGTSALVPKTVLGATKGEVPEDSSRARDPPSALDVSLGAEMRPANEGMLCLRILIYV